MVGPCGGMSVWNCHVGYGDVAMLVVKRAKELAVGAGLSSCSPSTEESHFLREGYEVQWFHSIKKMKCLLGVEPRADVISNKKILLLCTPHRYRATGSVIIYTLHH